MLQISGLINEKASVDDIYKTYREMVQQRVALACFKENSDEIVGLNMTYFTLQKDEGTKMKVRFNDIYFSIRNNDSIS